MIKELQLLGMTRNEAIVYWALVKNNPCRASALIDALDMHRNLIYIALDSLITKGYATKVSVRGVWRFQISDPGIILSNLKRHEEIARNVIQEISAFSANTSRMMKVHEGIESYRRYWLTSMERVPTGTIDYVAGGEIKLWKDFMGKQMDEIWKLYTQKEIQWKSLYFGITEEEKGLLNKLPIRYEARNWAKEMPRKFDGNFNVIHDSVILHTMSEPPRIIEIRDEALVPMFQNYFDIMWAQAEPITS
jgi:DNA-binding MarR family transcriptional regulator